MKYKLVSPADNIICGAGVFNNTLIRLFFWFIGICDGNSFLIIIEIPFEGLIFISLFSPYYYIFILDNNILVNYVEINKPG